ncbi:MAG: hypothetical protein ABSH20_04485 [Tepidisphaeraceae bacterium]|jgi:hypothetical protein
MFSTPGGLAAYLPDSWQEMISKGGLTVAFLISGLAGCSESGLVPTATPTTPAAASATSQPTTRAAMFASAAAIVAPIFEHGEGIAVTGCVVIAPPVFLTEEEGRQIIIEELKKVGVNMSVQNVHLKTMTVRQRQTVVVDDSPLGREVRDTEVDVPYELVLDLVDPEKHVAAEYISKRGCNELGGVSRNAMGFDYGYRDCAGKLADAIRRDGKGHFVGVFYDPGNIKPGHGWLNKNEAESISRDELRQQVRDFAEWLRQRGVI